MEANLVDTVFVRARRRDVHAVLEDVAGYPRWWPGVTVLASGSDRYRVGFDPPGVRAAAHEVTLTVTKNRRERHLGIAFRYAGDLRGEAEWYYLDEPAGALVHYALRAHALGRRKRQLVTGHRRCVRMALNRLKDALEADRAPGAEPDPALLADQRAALADFEAGVRRHARATAAAPGPDAPELRPER